MFDDNKDGRIERSEFAEAYMRISGFDTDHKSTYWSEARVIKCRICFLLERHI